MLHVLPLQKALIGSVMQCGPQVLMKNYLATKAGRGGGVYVVHSLLLFVVATTQQLHYLKLPYGCDMGVILS